MAAESTGVSEPDVLVIGSGMAGLITARDLSDRGYSVRILEARDRVGGRTYTRPFAGHPEVTVEAGGAYLNPKVEHNVRREVERYGVGITYGQGGLDDVRFVVNGKLFKTLPIPVRQLGELERTIVALSTDARRIHPVVPLPEQVVADLDCSISDYLARLDLSEETYDFVAGAVAGFIQADIDTTSIMQTLINIQSCGGSPVDTLFGTFGGTFDNGIGELVTALADDAAPEVVLNAEVAKVSHTEVGVTVTTVGGATHSAPACVVAAPAWTLGRIEFDPPLPAAKRAALEREHTIRGVKKLLIVEGVPRGFFGIGGITAQYQWLMVDKELEDGRVLMVTFAIGEEHASNDLDLARSAISEFLPEANVIAVDGEDWFHDPLTRGIVGFCPTGLGQNFAYDMSRPQGRLAFAGAEMVPDVLFFGWIEGAIQSGHEAARYIGTVVSPMTKRPELFNVHDVEREAFPEFDGHKAVLFESPDGRMLSATYWLKGKHTWELPYDDHFFVIAGSATVTVDDLEPFEVTAGSYCHLTKGSTVTFDMSDDFHEVSTLVSDEPIDVTSH